jgi:hypothetical protein
LDKELAQELVQFLQLSTGLSSSQVFCSSIDGYGIPTGASFMTFIQRQLQNTIMVIPLITPAYLDSLFCQWELGAVWARRSLPLFPIRVGTVNHAHLPAPLAQLQIAEFTQSGLLDLAETVAKVFKLQQSSRRALEPAARLLSNHSGVLARLVPVWATTPQARLRRTSRPASASKHLHQVFHKERDASFLLIVDRHPTPHLANLFLEQLREVTKSLATYFSEVTNTPCRVTLKQFLAEADDNYFVVDLARNHGPRRTTPDPIVGNTDFETILRADENFFWSNDLEREVANGYKNTHGVPGHGLSYRSTIVWPVRKRFSSHEVAAQVKAPLPDHHLLGFLCVDASVPDAFDQADFEIGAAVADSLYAILYPFLDHSSP